MGKDGQSLRLPRSPSNWRGGEKLAKIKGERRERIRKAEEEPLAAFVFFFGNAEGCIHF